MKKKILVLLTAVLMSLSAICFASDGTDLDYEQKAVDVFMQGKNYNEVLKYMDPEMTKSFPPDQYKKMFDAMNKALGSMKSKRMVVYQKLNGGDVLRYRAVYEKVPVMEIIAAFRNENGKITMMDMMVLEPEQKSSGNTTASSNAKK
ncbi:MAG: DUF3887 domain-containing protein [Succiniclasticum sp.]|jgi:hypothetical protein